MAADETYSWGGCERCEDLEEALQRARDEGQRLRDEIAWRDSERLFLRRIVKACGYTPWARDGWEAEEDEQVCMLSPREPTEEEAEADRLRATVKRGNHDR